MNKRLEVALDRALDLALKAQEAAEASGNKPELVRRAGLIIDRASDLMERVYPVPAAALDAEGDEA